MMRSCAVCALLFVILFFHRMADDAAEFLMFADILRIGFYQLLIFKK